MSEQLNSINTFLKQDERIWDQIFAMADRNNCTIVFAAGNDNMVAGVDPKKRSSRAIKVSALDRNLGKAGFSNYGVYPALRREYSTLSAPGVGIYSAAPGGQYVSLQGTSMAAPIVTGAVALLKSVDQTLTTDEIVRLLKETGKDVGDNIGPMVRIGQALQALEGAPVVDGRCEAVRKEMAVLRARMDSLARICPDAAVPGDTLKFADAVRDAHGLDGVWKSTTQLVSMGDMSPIELYMSFSQLKGQLVIVNHGMEYTAPLRAEIGGGQIRIFQDVPATSSAGSFLPYVYQCQADWQGNLQCVATSAMNRAMFNLVRIK